MSRVGVSALSIALFTTAAAAQIPKGNVFFGYSYLRTDLTSGTHNNLNGWNGWLEGKFLPWIGIVADLSGHYGSAEIPSPALQVVIPVRRTPSCTVSYSGPEFLSLWGKDHAFCPRIIWRVAYYGKRLWIFHFGHIIR